MRWRPRAAHADQVVHAGLGYLLHAGMPCTYNVRARYACKRLAGRRPWRLARLSGRAILFLQPSAFLGRVRRLTERAMTFVVDVTRLCGTSYSRLFEQVGVECKQRE